MPDIADPDDALGWHEMIPQDGPAVRRLDVWQENGQLQAEAHFQDSANGPTGGRIAVHEYLLTASADAASRMLLARRPEPRILPYIECSGFVPLTTALLGQDLSCLRRSVLETLPNTQGCTHLNDMLRSLALQL